MKAFFEQRILVVEDDPRMRELLCKGLREVGHTPMPAADGEAGLELAMTHEFDAIVLDLGLPGRDGMQIIQILRDRDRWTPVVILTARDAEDEVIRGLDSGADHYMIKPFSFPELLARLNGLARSPRRGSFASQIVLNPSRQSVLREGRIIQLTRSEYMLLAALNECAGHAVHRQLLTEAVWGIRSVDPNTLDVLVNSLRSKFDGPYSTKQVVTVRGVGYALQVQNAQAIASARSLECSR